MLDQRLATRVENFVSRLKRESVCMHGFILDVRGEVKATAYYPPFEEGEAHRYVLGVQIHDGACHSPPAWTKKKFRWMTALPTTSVTSCPKSRMRA